MFFDFCITITTLGIICNFFNQTAMQYSLLCNPTAILSLEFVSYQCLIPQLMLCWIQHEKYMMSK